MDQKALKITINNYIKENIDCKSDPFDIITEMLYLYPGLDVDYAKKQLEKTDFILGILNTLNMENIQVFQSYYDMEKNELLIDSSSLPHTIIHELIHIITSKKEPNLNLIGLQRQEIDNTSGKKVITNYNIGLNEAITEMIATQISGGAEKNKEFYLIEQNILQQLFLIVDKDSVIEAYCTNDLDKFKQLFYDKGLTYDQVEFIINSVDTLSTKKVIIEELLDNRQKRLYNTIKSGEEKELVPEELLYEVQKIIFDNIKNDKNKKEQFKDLIIDRKKVENYEDFQKIPYDLDNMGYRGIDKIHEYILKEEKEMDESIVTQSKVKTKKEEVINQWEEIKDAMLKRIKNGKIVKEIISKDDVYGDDKVVITQTENGTYSYQIFAPGSDTPYYVAEAAYYFDDITKRTASDGTVLRYQGAKSAISRNLLGLFSEYRTEDKYKDFYICFKSPEDAEIPVAQRMAGGYKQDAIVLVDVDFNKRTIAMPTGIQIITKNGKQQIIVGISPNWTDEMFVDYAKELKEAAESNSVLPLFGEKPMSHSELEDHVQQEIRNAFLLMSDTFASFGIQIEGEGKTNIFANPKLYGEAFKGKNPSLLSIPIETSSSKSPQSQNDTIKALIEENNQLDTQISTELEGKETDGIEPGEE